MKTDNPDYIQALEVLLGRLAEITDSDNTLEVKHMRIAQLLKKTGWL